MFASAGFGTLPLELRILVSIMSGIAMLAIVQMAQGRYTDAMTRRFGRAWRLLAAERSKESTVTVTIAVGKHSWVRPGLAEAIQALGAFSGTIRTPMQRLVLNDVLIAHHSSDKRSLRLTVEVDTSEGRAIGYC